MNTSTSLTQARLAKSKATEMLSHVDGIVGIGLTQQGEYYAVKINLDRALPPGTVPEQIDGIAVLVEVVGSIRPF